MENVKEYNYNMKKKYLAIDIGASSGRHIVGWEENGEIKTEEVYRFQNGVKKIKNQRIWDIDGLFENVKEGIKQAFLKHEGIVSLAIDTWGVDYVLMHRDTPILPCVSYRDNRTKEASKEVHKLYPFKQLYRRTGIGFNAFNTIYQLFDDKLSGKLNSATDFLMMPEYLTYCLTGIKAHEYTNATTTGLLNVQTGDYDQDIIEELDLPERIFKKPQPAGTYIGPLKEEIAQEVGGQIEVVLCASHDTASAVAAIPMQKNNPYISSGTWSVLGLQIDKAITDVRSRRAGYSNEGGAKGFCYQKNIMGMWIVNNLKKELCPDLSFNEIVQQARESFFDGMIDVGDDKFLAPESMKEAFDSCFQEKPQTVGDYFKCALVSLAYGYKDGLEELSRITGQAFDKLYIVGGGAKNAYLNELTEEICKIKVVALPIEATAIGNLKIQMERR